MASKIEHITKYEAYSDALAWSEGSDKDTIIWWLKEKVDAHKGYLQETNTKKRAYHGSKPRNRFLNWLGHKLLVWAWGRKSYLAITMSPEWQALAGGQTQGEDGQKPQVS